MLDRPVGQGVHHHVDKGRTATADHAHDVKVCFLNFNHRAQAAQDLLNQGAGRFNHLLR